MDPASTIILVVLVILYAWIGYNVWIVAVGTKHLLQEKHRKGGLKRKNGRLPTVSILVPVKNEEKVVDRLLRSLLKLNYPSDKREIVVVEDGSTDRTIELCQEHADLSPSQVKVFQRMVSEGKPSALNHGLKHVTGEIVGVFDADSVPEADCLMKAAEYFEDPKIAAVQGRTCSINADQNMLTKIVSCEEAIRFGTHFQGKDCLDIFVPLAGSCYFVRKSVLEEVGGWNVSALSEDMELSARLTDRDYKIKYAPSVKSWQENPPSLNQFLKQRNRWFRGCMEVALRYGRLVEKANWRRLDAEITLAGPFMSVLFITGYLLGIFVILGSLQPQAYAAALAQSATYMTTAALVLAGAALMWLTKPRKLSNLLWLPFVYVYWSLQNLIAAHALFQIILKRPKRWVKTKKTGVATNHDKT